MRGFSGKWRGTVGMLALLAACGGQPGELALVEIDGQPILASDLRAFEAGLLEYLRADQQTEEAHRLHLQNLVDRRLMFLEARHREIDRLPALEKVVAEQVDERLLSRMVAEQVNARISISEEEIKAEYEENDMGWEVWPAHILSATEEEAWEVIWLLEDGADFSALARERSLAEDAERGGNLGAYFDEKRMLPAFYEAIIDLEVEQYTRPVKTFEGYEVIMVLDKRRIPYELMRDQIARRLWQRKQFAGRAALAKELRERWDLRYYREWTWAVLKGFRGGHLDPAERAAPFISFADQRLTVEDTFRIIREKNPRRAPTDSLILFDYLEAAVIPQTLIAFAARSEGWHQTPEILAWKESKRKDLIVSQLYIDEVTSAVQAVTDAEVEQHYLENLENYRKVPGPIELTEVIVDTREEAEAILAAVGRGERLEVLAIRHSVRPQIKPWGGHTVGDSGKIHIGERISSPYRTFFGVAEDNYRDVGKLQGPLVVEERKYSVFRLDEPALLTPLPLRQVQRPIRKRLREQREATRFAVFIDSLRQAYAERVNWHEGNLRRYAAAR